MILREVKFILVAGARVGKWSRISMTMAFAFGKTGTFISPAMDGRSVNIRCRLVRSYSLDSATLLSSQATSR
jgi:hypothetical protein